MKNAIIVILTSLCMVFTIPAVSMADDLSSGISDKAAAMFKTQNADSLDTAPLSEKEMKETEGELLGVFAGALLSAAASAWIHHGTQYYNTGHLGSSAGAAYAAGTGFVTGGIAKGISSAAKLGNLGSIYFRGRGMAQNYSLNRFNPDNY